MHLLWPTGWTATNNHCSRSRGDCTRIISRLGQISSVFPISVFVFGDCRYVAWRTIGISTDDINAFNCWSRSIECYSENQFETKSLVQSQHLLITVREWKVSCLFPFSSFIIKNFGLQSISVWIMSSNKWWFLVRSQCQDVKMRELRGCFRFKIDSVEPKKKFWVIYNEPCSELTNDMLAGHCKKNITWFQMKMCCIHQHKNWRVVRQHLLICNLLLCSSKTAFDQIILPTFHKTIVSLQKYLTFFILATKYPHFIIQRRRTRVVNFSIRFICEV